MKLSKRKETNKDDFSISTFIHSIASERLEVRNIDDKRVLTEYLVKKYL